MQFDQKRDLPAITKTLSPLLTECDVVELEVEEIGIIKNAVERKIMK
jgi:hypothetical protein